MLERNEMNTVCLRSWVKVSILKKRKLLDKLCDDHSVSSTCCGPIFRLH